ncbi:hypothetical protein A8806_110157 [Faecalicatena orotica]|uniref:Phage minor structural protein GP20 n=1 Tax=Faecalicatena orotica TaxID=1544 RepID=A0A2Y9BKV0_9FIRM|nr:hypothetical protein [Faecalicatena orotica]PWJ27982.1 hypothetical protein A8806_110157 [Faecalicatena orotica]SSA57005.1 hypothetical protein SAMN05216536_110157 [Faecalicatena orotica]
MRKRIFRCKLPMDIQHFAEPGAGGGTGGTGTGGTSQQTQQQATGGQTAAEPQIDYDKLAQLVTGKQAATEESVIKGYLKQQGLTKEQMDQAIATFKQQQAASQPDVEALQTQAAQAQAAAQQAQVQAAATMSAVGLGIDAKTIPYIIKMADLSKVTGEDGKINDEAMKTALNKVLEDIPALKPQTQKSTGFVQVGATGAGQQQTSTDDALKKAFGL